MSLIEPTPNGASLSSRDSERLLSSIRKDARKIRDVLATMTRDADKLEGGGSPAPAAVLRKAISAMEVALDHIREVFKLAV
jgi:hypothetical protein